MKKKFTLDEMRGIWKRRLGILEDDCGCIVTRHDGNSLQALLDQTIRGWYGRLLRTCDPALLPVEDLHAEATVKEKGDNCLEVLPPPRGIRLLSVKLTDWSVPLGSVSSPDSDAARLQTNRFLGATPEYPVAVTDGFHYLLYGLREGRPSVPDPARRLESLVMVAAPDEADIFELDESLLETIPEDL